MPTALIVEDEPEANKLLAMLIQLRGYRTDSAFTGGEALEIVEREPPDIVFLDLMLPDIDGFEVCKRLKAEPSTSLIPVVMVTARVAEENRSQSFRVGADDYIPKPYTPDQIFEAIADADAWRRELECLSSEGEIALRDEEDEGLRGLARLRNLLVARTSLSADAVLKVGETLESIVADAAAWGRQHQVEAVAELRYLIEADRVTMMIHETSGWLAEDPNPPETRWPEALPPGRFDDLRLDNARRTLTMVLRLPASDHSADGRHPS